MLVSIKLFDIVNIHDNILIYTILAGIIYILCSWVFGGFLNYFIRNISKYLDYFNKTRKDNNKELNLLMFLINSPSMIFSFISGATIFISLLSFESPNKSIANYLTYVNKKYIELFFIAVGASVFVGFVLLMSINIAYSISFNFSKNISCLKYRNILASIIWIFILILIGISVHFIISII